MTHPYSDLPASAFWRSAVAEADPAALAGIHHPKFRLDQQSAIVTAGSCFAQHVGRALKASGLNLLDGEPAPDIIPEPLARDYGFGVYSARYGNIYTTRQLLQLLQDAQSLRCDPADIWMRDGRFYDALRPTIEPNGFASRDEALALRLAHLHAVQALLRQATHFIFTLGLTECWIDQQTGRVFPTCPGVVAGEFDPARHAFVNLGWRDVSRELAQIRALLHENDPNMRMILTVSPVPLTATASGRHVLAASTRSKAVLRAAAGEFADDHEDVDYFPSYEIVTNPAARSSFYTPGLREVRPDGVRAAMGAFLQAHGLRQAPSRPAKPAGAPENDPASDVICEEILLEAFRK